MSIYFLQRSSYCWNASAKFAAAPFFVPPSAPTGRPPDWGWCQLACFLPPADPQTMRKLSEMVKKPRRSSLWSPGQFWIASSSSPRKAVWSLIWPTSWKRQFLLKSSINRFNRHTMDLSEFHDTLSTIILHFGSDIGNGHRRGEISLIRWHHCPSSYFACW